MIGLIAPTFVDRSRWSVSLDCLKRVGHTARYRDRRIKRVQDQLKMDSGLRIRLYGPPYAIAPDTQGLSGQRTLALIALLATAPEMRRSRTWLIAHLWSDFAPERARGNLRQLLHALRQVLGPDFDRYFCVTRDFIGLRPESVTLVGVSDDGTFLEGLDLQDESFEDWLREIRQAQPERQPESRAHRHKPYQDRSEFLFPRIMVRPIAEIGDFTGLGDAIAQEMTLTFARSQIIDAISHFSSRTDAVNIGNEAFADYALTGTCRSKNNHVILDVSLADTGSGKVLWADRQNIDLRAFLAGEDETTLLLAGQVIRVLLSRSIAETSSKPMPELGAHTLMISAVGRMHSFDPLQFELARSQLEEVIQRCPGDSVPRAWLAQWHLLRIYQKWTDQASRDRQCAINAIKNALDLNASCPLSLAIDGNVQTILVNDFKTAQSRFEAAKAINPSSAFNSQIESVLATFTDDGARAVALSDRAYHLSPRDPRRPFFQTLSAGSYVAGGRYLEAVEMAEASIRHHPQHLSAHRCRVIGLQLAEREEDARKAALELMQRDPNLRVSDYIKGHPARDTDVLRTWADALRRAGIPEK